MSWQVHIPHILPGQGYSVVTGKPGGRDNCFHPSITTPRRKTQNVPACRKILEIFFATKNPRRSLCGDNKKPPDFFSETKWLCTVMFLSVIYHVFLKLRPHGLQVLGNGTVGFESEFFSNIFLRFSFFAHFENLLIFV